MATTPLRPVPRRPAGLGAGHAAASLGGAGQEPRRSGPGVMLLDRLRKGAGRPGHAEVLRKGIDLLGLKSLPAGAVCPRWL